MIFRPATPGFLITLVATILLALVVFNAPYIKSQYFLKGTLSIQNINGSIELGTLGYCLNLPNGTTCSKPSIGYQFDPNALLGDKISFAQIPQVVVKWVTYALFLHVIALVAAAISAVFGLLAHVREMSMTYCSTWISGMAAVIAMVAFIFDLVLFFVVKSRIKALPGGSAQLGISIWLTVVAWVLLFFSGCFFKCGQSCIRRRPRGNDGWDNNNKNNAGGNGNGFGGFFGGRPAGGNGDPYAEQMRMEAIKAEEARKTQQRNQKEQGLPAFPEREDASKPLNPTAQYLEDEDEEAAAGSLPYRDANNIAGAGAAAPRRQTSGNQPQAYRGGYAQAAPGTRAMDDYYNPSSQAGYPPNQHTASSTYSRSNYSQSVRSQPGVIGGTPAQSPPLPTATPSNQYLAVGGAAAHSQYPSGRDYGHANGGSTYHTAESQHQQYPSSYSQYNDPYTSSHQQQPSFNPGSYNQAGAIGGFVSSSSPNPYSRSPSHSTSPPPAQPSTYYNQSTQHQPERSYTLGGGGYGASTVPDTTADPYYGSAAYGGGYGANDNAAQPHAAIGGGYGYAGAHPSVINTNVPTASNNYTTSPVNMGAGAMQPHAMGGGFQQPQHQTSYDDSPPGYESGPAQQPGAWAEKSAR